MVYVIIGILLPFLSTTFGSSFVFFLKDKLNNKIEKLLIGISIGVMLSSSIFSLLIPSINMSNRKVLTPLIGVSLGYLFLLLISKIMEDKEKRSLNMMMFSVTLHNIPEGMVVGVAFASAISNINSISLISAFILSIGISIQNIPEGMIISMPYKMNGYSKIDSFLMGMLSGIVEPIFALLTLLLLNYSVPLLPYLLSFACGSMINVVINELMPDLNKNKSIYGIIGILIGFLIMMILDISFG